MEYEVLEIARQTNKFAMIMMIIVTTLSLGALGLSEYNRHLTNKKINAMAEVIDANLEIQNKNIENFIDHVNESRKGLDW